MLDLKFKAYDLICRAVEDGSAFGVNRAFKHTDNPNRDEVIDNVVREVLNAICDIIDFDDEPR